MAKIIVFAPAERPEPIDPPSGWFGLAVVIGAICASGAAVAYGLFLLAGAIR